LNLAAGSGSNYADAQRDRSLNAEMGETIARLGHLRSLEISGHSVGYYDPKLFASSALLEDLRIMIPDSKLIAALPGIVKALAGRRTGGLRGLGIIARVSGAWQHDVRD